MDINIINEQIANYKNLENKRISITDELKEAEIVLYGTIKDGVKELMDLYSEAFPLEGIGDLRRIFKEMVEQIADNMYEPYKDNELDEDN